MRLTVVIFLLVSFIAAAQSFTGIFNNDPKPQGPFGLIPSWVSLKNEYSYPYVPFFLQPVVTLISVPFYLGQWLWFILSLLTKPTVLMEFWNMFFNMAKNDYTVSSEVAYSYGNLLYPQTYVAPVKPITSSWGDSWIASLILLPWTIVTFPFKIIAFVLRVLVSPIKIILFFVNLFFTPVSIFLWPLKLLL